MSTGVYLLMFRNNEVLPSSGSSCGFRVNVEVEVF
jgi:hypothetical protein